MGNEPILKFILNLLYGFGLDPTRNWTILTFTWLIIYYVFNVMIFVLSVMYLCINYGELDLAKFGELADSFASVGQISVKLYTLTRYRKLLAKLLKDIEGFWTITDESEDIIEEINRVYQVFEWTIKVISFLLAGVIISYSAYSFIGKKLFLLTYVPNRYYFTENVIFFCQFIYATENIFLVLAFEGVYLYICTKIVIQLKLLRYRIENITKYENPDQELNKCIKHHIELIEFISTLINIYDFYLFCQYLISLFSSGLKLFQFTSDVSDYKMLGKTACYTLTIYAEFGYVYCYTSQKIHDGLLAISDAVYNSEWYNVDLKLRRKLLIVLMASQKSYVFTAFALGYINLATFTNVFRASISMFTFFREMNT